MDQCPTEALRFGEEEDFADFIAEAEPFRPEAKTKSRIYYKGLPKKFIAGTLYEPNIEEVIIGAACTLKSVRRIPYEHSLILRNYLCAAGEIKVPAVHLKWDA